MFKDLLVKLANKIINKYGIHILDQGSIIQMYNTRFYIKSYQFSKSYDYYSKLNLEAVDIFEKLEYKIN